ncbi:hypothetical protein EB796_021554 [Bugula neritina]|uniref:Uncharacterized protein n=1 Tax=Bugula neritina TaxID=10212 RepID=A0A7J7J1Q4_BUGNE|nr:hypothetical protein EB796_021554 [Bugula neritina]
MDTNYIRVAFSVVNQVVGKGLVKRAVVACLLLLVVVGLTVAVEWTPAKIAAVMNSTPVEVFIDYLEPDLKELVQSKRQLQSQEVKYSHKYLINPLFQDCPTEHVVCCAQFHLVNGNCIHAVTLAKELTLPELQALMAETGSAGNEKREITGPDGQPIDLAQFGQVQIDPK